MKVLFVTPELAPLAKGGGLGDVCRALPQALTKLGVSVDIILPYYRCIKEFSQLTKPKLLAENLPVYLGWRRIDADIYTAQFNEQIRLFLVNRDEFYDRSQIYGTNKGGYFDNAERYAYFCQATLAMIERLNSHYDLIHCHDWQTALIPVYLKTRYFHHPQMATIKTVLTIHNLGYQGVFPAEVFGMTNLPDYLFSIEGLEFWGQVNFLKGGIVFADFITTVSPTYAKEIQTKEYGFGLDGVLRVYAHKLKGILNGADYSEWNPETDTYIAANFSAKELKGKDLCKKDLLKTCGLPLDNANWPVLAMVSRLVEQKGIEILLPVIERLMEQNVCLIVLGTGERRYEEALTELAARYPSQMFVKIGFNNALAHKIIAGADIFLMPSRYESCGLTQLYSLRYGTIPVVRNTGGLADTIIDASHPKGNGFKFEEYSPQAFLKAINRALDCLRHHPNRWHELIINAMSCRFSWEQSAKEYLKVYQQVTGKDTV